MSSKFEISVGVMARAPLPGRCKTRLARELGDDEAASLYHAMLLDTLDAYATLSVRTHILLAAPEDDGAELLRGIAPSPWQILVQHGDDLGARLANAQQLLRPGGVVLVSSDSPNPPVANIATELEAWDAHRDVLLGPCADGGYYLIGLAAPETRVFQGIEWSTPKVAEQTRDRCRELGLRVRELPAATDVDEVSDLTRLRAELARQPDAARRTRKVLAVS